MNGIHFSKSCEVCNKGINDGFTNMEGEFVVCTECFKAYMDKTYGHGLWRQTDDDGQEGFYEFRESFSSSKYYGTGIFWIQWG